MSEYKIQEVLEQEATFDGGFKLPVDPYLLMKIVNHCGTHDEDEKKEMDNPKRIVTRVIIETKEL